MHFLQQPGLTKNQKYYYEQEDGEVESKITTASPSKTQYYSKQMEDMTPNIVLENPNNLAQGRKEIHQTLQQNLGSMSMTEKKLNNYLQQAKYLMNNQQNLQPYQQNEITLLGSNLGKNSSGVLSNSASSANRASKYKNYSYDTEVYSNSNKSSTIIHPVQNPSIEGPNIHELDSCPSSKILFNALDDFDNGNQIKIKDSFSSKKQPTATKKRLAKLEEQRKSQSDAKKNLSKAQNNLKQGVVPTNLNLKGFQAHRLSQVSKVSKKSLIGSTSVRNADKVSINQIVDQFDNIILEEQNTYGQAAGTYDDDYQQQSYDGQLRVLDYDYDERGNVQQMDLENIKSVNKRQTSKTEVFSPSSFNQGLHKKNQGSHIPKAQVNKGTKQMQGTNFGGSSHKKTVSQVQAIQKSVIVQQNQTRNTTLNKKHMTVTTSPVMNKLPSENDARLSKQTSQSTSKKVQKSLPTQPSPKKRAKPQNTIEIVEDQQEEEDHKSDQQSKIARFQLQQREFDIINQTISPSSASSFQFQPKFFKPNRENAHQLNPPTNQSTVRFISEEEAPVTLRQQYPSRQELEDQL